MSLYEADFTTGIEQSVRQSERLRRHEVDVAVRCCCPTYTGSEVSNCVGSVLGSRFVHCGSCVFFVGLLVGFLWTCGGQSMLD